MFAQSVQMHLQSDVPLGVALSGGMDSSALAMAAGEAVGRSRPLKTFTFVAAGRDLGEEHFADLVIGRSGATAHKIHQNDAGRIRTDASATGSPGDFLEDLEAVLQSQDEPFGSTSIFAQCRVFRAAARAGVKVMLDGQGGDELFAGYPPMFAWRIASLLKRGCLAGAWRLWRDLRRGTGAGGLPARAFGALLPRRWPPRPDAWLASGSYPPG